MSMFWLKMAQNPTCCFLKVPKNSKDPEFGQEGGKADGKARVLWGKGRLWDSWKVLGGVEASLTFRSM